MDDEQFRQLLAHFAMSWAGYRKVRKGVKKRLRRHMRDLGCGDVGEYLERLGRDKRLRRECELRMSVPISRFFRDRKLWEALEADILPEITATGESRVKVWSAGCACGEEVYSLKIIWERLRNTGRKLPRIEITATDLNPVNLQKARDGIYPASSLKAVPYGIRSTFFQARRGGKRFKILPALASGIVWIEQDFFQGPPGAGYQLVLLRNNLLTYFQPERISPALDKMTASLSIGGYLVTGSREKHPLESKALEPYAPLPYIFKKKAEL